MLECLGRAEEASAEAQRAVELDPLAVLFRHYFAPYYLCTGEHHRAAKHSRYALDIDPSYGLAMGVLALMGRHDEGIELITKSLRLIPGEYFPAGFLGWAYIRAGRRSDAQAFLAQTGRKAARAICTLRHARPGSLGAEGREGRFRLGGKGGPGA